MKTIMKTGLLACAIMSAFATTSNAQTVTGSGSGGIFAGNIPRWNASSNLTNSLIWDDGTTVILGTVKSTPWNYMLINQNGPSGSYNTGLNIELFNMNAGGTVQGAAFNIQGNQTNTGLNSYAAGGTNSTAGIFAAANASSRNKGIESSATGGSESYGGIFEAADASFINYGVDGRAENGQHSAGGNFYAEGATSTNDGVLGEARGGSQSAGGSFHASQALQTWGVSGWGIGNGAPSSIARGGHLYANGAQTNYGVEAMANGTGTGVTNYGIFSSASGGTTNVAGYFNGDVNYTAGLVFVSDRKFKENIKPIESSMDKIMMLSPKTYTFNEQYPSMNFAHGKQFGFIAQEVAEVLPELVKAGIHPAKYNDKGEKIIDAVEYKGIEYVSIVPILVAGMQEQQKTIELQNEKISNLEEQIKKIQAGSNSTGINTYSSTGAELYQNSPNPFNGYTTISYLLPNNYGQAKIMVFDMNGKHIKAIDLNERGKGSITISADELSAGMYLYSLMVDGKEVATKRMILSNN